MLPASCSVRSPYAIAALTRLPGWTVSTCKPCACTADHVTACRRRPASCRDAFWWHGGAIAGVCTARSIEAGREARQPPGCSLAGLRIVPEHPHPLLLQCMLQHYGCRGTQLFAGIHDDAGGGASRSGCARYPPASGRHCSVRILAATQSHIRLIPMMSLQTHHPPDYFLPPQCDRVFATGRPGACASPGSRP